MAGINDISNAISWNGYNKKPNRDIQIYEKQRRLG